MNAVIKIVIKNNCILNCHPKFILQEKKGLLKIKFKSN